MTLNLNDAVRLATIIRGVQRKDMFIMYDSLTEKITKGQLLRIYRHGEMPGEDFARDTDDILDLAIEVEYPDFTKGFIPVLDALNLARADCFFVE